MGVVSGFNFTSSTGLSIGGGGATGSGVGGATTGSGGGACVTGGGGG